MAAEAACRCSLAPYSSLANSHGAHTLALSSETRVSSAFFEPATACDTAGAFKRPTAYEATSTNESAPHYDATGSHECAATYERPTTYEIGKHNASGSDCLPTHNQSGSLSGGGQTGHTPRMMSY